MTRARGRRLPLAGLREILGVDLRSLALLRIGLGGTLILDLLYRARFLAAQYSDAGILPRARLAESLAPTSPLALHALSGSVAWQALLFGIALVSAVLLLLGYRTRLACAVSWVLMVSLHLRQPFLLDGGSHVPRLLLFWGLFLPLGERFSLDARRHPQRVRTDPLHVSIASAALLVQVAVIYLFAGLAKTGPQWRVHGTALHWVLLDSQWVQPPAAVLLQLPDLLRPLSFGILGLEILAPLLLFAPLWNGPLRSLACAGFLGLQLGIGLTMWVGLFPLANFAAALGLLPGWLWQRLPARWRAQRSSAGAEPPAPTGARLAFARAQQGVAALALAWVLLVNLENRDPRLALPAWFLAPGHAIQLYQRWEMYGPSPRRAEVRYDALGATRDGRSVTLRDEGPGEGWKAVQAIQSDYHFKAGQFLWRGQPESELLKRAYADWLCRQWNADAPPERALASVTLVAWLRRLSLDGAHAPWQAERVLDHPCAPAAPTSGSSP